MKICCFGSLNIDHVYRVKRFVNAGETISSIERSIVCGGKGLNQSIALARCGAKVYHAGNVGATDGITLINALQSNGVDVRYVYQQNAASGHAIIQVDSAGENSILLCAGTNYSVTREQIERVLDAFEPGDYILLQNEINMVGEIVRRAHERSLKVMLNPSPVDGILADVPLEMVDYLFAKEAEICSLTGMTVVEAAILALHERYPDMMIICICSDGSALVYNGEFIRADARRAAAVDTTGANDAFIGYFAGLMMEGGSLARCLECAIAAAALCTERVGSSVSIPQRDQVEAACAKCVV